MKHVKKLGILVMAAILCVALASCGGLAPSSYLEVDPVTGAGKASFTMMVPKNGVDDIGNNFIEPNGDEEPKAEGYIKNPNALLNLFKSKVPSGFDVTMKEQTNMVTVETEDGDEDTVDKGSFDYTVTFSFSSIDDYNAKIKTWLPAKYWDLANAAYPDNKIKEVTMTTTGDAKNATVTLATDMRILDVVCQWVFDVASTDKTGAVVDGGSGFDYQYFWNMDKGSYAVKFNGKETKKAYSAAKSAISVEAAGIDTSKPADEPASTPADKPASTPDDKPASTNPATGEPLAVSAAVLIAAAAGALLFARKRSK